MKGLVKYQEGNGFMEIRDVAEPRPASGQVKIAVSYTGICGSDIHIYHNDIAIPLRPPVITGHEFSGTIVEVGPDVEGWKPGDRVVSETAFSYCGTCMHCREGFYNLCNERRTLGYWYNGAFAAYTVVPAGRLHRLPDSISFEEGAFTEPLACVTHAVYELTEIVPSDVVLVSGPGAVGLAALQVARAQGARVVVSGTAIDRERLKVAESLGAERVVDVGSESLKEVIDEMTGGTGADVVLECSGNNHGLNAALEVIRKRGRLTQIGLFGKPVTVDFEKICYKELKVTGSLGSRWISWKRALALMESGVVKVKPLISDVFPLTEWKPAFEKFEQKEGLKILIDPNK